MQLVSRSPEARQDALQTLLTRSTFVHCVRGIFPSSGINFPLRCIACAHIGPYSRLVRSFEACAREFQVVLTPRHNMHGLRLEEMPDKHRKIYKALNVIEYLAKNSIKVSPDK